MLQLSPFLSLLFPSLQAWIVLPQSVSFCSCFPLLLQQFMINKVQSRPDYCPSCSNTALERIGSEYYCPTCQKVQILFEDDVRMVPSKYESNSKGHRQLQNDRRLNALINQFTDKYHELSADEAAHFRQRLAALKGETPRKKGSREAAGVVAFMGLGDEVRLNIRQFCQRNNLSVRLFNQKYKVYQKLFPTSKGTQQQEDSEDVKQEKLEQSSPTEKSQAPSTSTPILKNARHAISIIFDDVFSKFIFRSKRRQITESLVQRLQRVDEQLLHCIRYQEKPPLKLYYLIFAVLKSLKHKISYLEFSNIVLNKANHIMKRKAAAEVRKHYEAFLKERCVKQEAEGEEEEEEEGVSGVAVGDQGKENIEDSAL